MGCYFLGNIEISVELIKIYEDMRLGFLRYEIKMVRQEDQSQREQLEMLQYFDILEILGLVIFGNFW